MAAAKKIKFNEDGTVTLPLWDDKDKPCNVTIQEPRVKHIKKFEALADRLDDEARPIRAKAQALGATRTEILLDENDKRKTLTATEQEKLSELEQEIAEFSAEIRDVNNQAAAAWLAEVAEDLGNKPEAALEPDDLPGWALDPSLPRKIIAHWKTAPLARSGS